MLRARLRPLLLIPARIQLHRRVNWRISLHDVQRVEKVIEHLLVLLVLLAAVWRDS